MLVRILFGEVLFSHDIAQNKCELIDKIFTNVLGSPIEKFKYLETITDLVHCTTFSDCNADAINRKIFGKLS